MRSGLVVITFLSIISISGCAQQLPEVPFIPVYNESEGYTANHLTADLDRGLTPHFSNWL